jgi:cysteine desulfurase family protein
MEGMKRFMESVGANPGRSGHRLSVEAGEVVNMARERVAALVGLTDPMRVVFGSNATDALNLGIRGLAEKGDHVITGSVEHNSVMRPLKDLEAQGVEVTVAPCDEMGFLDPDEVRAAIKPSTVLIVLNHASNVVGSLAPIREVGAIARDNDVAFLVDAAQTAGCVPIHMERDNIDLLAFTGHKSLMGPQGTGGLAIADDFDAAKLRRVRSGGTGSRSEHEVHPDFLPDKYESGTLNAVGLAGLAEGVGYVLDKTVEGIREKDMALTRELLEKAGNIDKIRVYGGLDEKRRTSTISFNIKGASPSDIAFSLDERHDIMCRAGLHCAPSAHRTIGTFPEGTVRFGLGYFNTPEEIDIAAEALKDLAGNGT